MPNQPVFSKPGSVFAIGGTPGSCGASALLVTPSARTRPLLMCGSVAATLVTVKAGLAAHQAGERRVLRPCTAPPRASTFAGVDEILRREVRLRADAGMAEGQLAGIRPRAVDQLLHRLVRRARRHRQTCGPETTLVTGTKSFSGS